MDSLPSFDLSDRAKWRLTGQDRIRYLNGQVTQDVRLASEERACYACVTNLKGKIEGDLYFHAWGDSLILDAPGALRESLSLRLEKYIIADDVILEDITEQWRIEHHLDLEKPAELLDGARLLSANRFGLPGRDVWIPAAASEPRGMLQGAAEAEVFRILHRVPAYPRELNQDTFPQEAGLEKSAMSFSKGCYLGQEILSRIKTSGKMPRELIGWEAMGKEEGLAEGSVLRLNEKEVGQITSLTRHPQTQRLVGLGFVRQGVVAVDSVLLVGDGVSSIQVTVKLSDLLNQ